MKMYEIFDVLHLKAGVLSDFSPFKEKLCLYLAEIKLCLYLADVLRAK